jgi:hypothetical protein
MACFSEIVATMPYTWYTVVWAWSRGGASYTNTGRMQCGGRDQGEVYFDRRQCTVHIQVHHVFVFYSWRLLNLVIPFLFCTAALQGSQLFDELLSAGRSPSGCALSKPSPLELDCERTAEGAFGERRSGPVLVPPFCAVWFSPPGPRLGDLTARRAALDRAQEVGVFFSRTHPCTCVLRRDEWRRASFFCRFCSP